MSAAALAAYANVLSNGFALDDEPIIALNGRVHDLSHPAAIWLTPYWPEYGGEAGLYRPLTVFAYVVQWAWGGGSPWLFHAVSLLLHAAVCVLLLVLLRRLVTPGAALLGALLFAVHPLHTEAVANVVGQAELLAALAVLGACLLQLDRPAPGGEAISARVRRGPAERLRVPALTLLFGLALLAKEGAIVLPALLVALDLATGKGSAKQGGPGRYVRGVAPLLLLLCLVAVAYLLLRIGVLGSLAGADAAPHLPLLKQTGPRLLLALAVWPQYLRLLFFPLDLAADYSPAVIVPPAGISVSVVVGALLLLGTTLLALRTARRPALGLPAAWFLIAILPVSNLLLPIGVLLAERTLYLPSVALALAAGYAVRHAGFRLTGERRRVAVVAVSVLLLAGGLRTFVRNPDWKSTGAFWNALVRDHPESYRAQRGVASMMDQRGDQAAARRYMEGAYQTWPHDPEMITELAIMRMRTSEFASAIPLLEHARALRAGSSRTHLNLARAYLGAGRYADAVDAARRVAAGAPDRVHALAVTAQALAAAGRPQDALAAWREVLRLPGGRAWTYALSYARALAHTRDRATALAAADSARALAPAPQHALVDSVRAAIEHGCYGGPGHGSNGAATGGRPAAHVPAEAGAACADPLGRWVVATEAGALERPAHGRNGA